MIFRRKHTPKGKACVCVVGGGGGGHWNSVCSKRVAQATYVIVSRPTMAAKCPPVPLMVRTLWYCPPYDTDLSEHTFKQETPVLTWRRYVCTPAQVCGLWRNCLQAAVCMLPTHWSLGPTVNWRQTRPYRSTVKPPKCCLSRFTLKNYIAGADSGWGGGGSWGSGPPLLGDPQTS